MNQAGGRRPLPLVWSVLLWGLAAAPVLALLHAAQDVASEQLQGRQTSLLYAWSHLLLPWATLSICAAGLVPLVLRFPLPQPRPARAVTAHLAALLAFPLIHLGLLDAIHVVFYQARFMEHLEWMLAGEGILDIPACLAIMGILHAARHVRTQRLLREEGLRLRAELVDARLEALRQRLQPHFLFNTLNSAAMLVRGGEAESAVELLARLGGLMRELLCESQSHTVPLSQEFHFLSEYLALEQIRFGSRLQVDLRLMPGLEDQPVPFLLLQPLVENAIRYGVGARAGTSTLSIGAEPDPAGLRCHVAEWGDGAHAATPEPGHGKGLALVRERLHSHYGDQASLHLHVSADGTRSCAEVILPAAEAER
jgi:two-component system, LytTR family, sensor kinase